MTRRAVALAVFAVLASSTAPATGEPVVESIKSGPADQFGPSAEDADWFGWTQFVRPLYTAKAQPMVDGDPEGTARVLRKRAGAHTFFGDFDPSFDVAIFQDNGGRNINANIYLADPANPGDISSPGSGINTRFWEWGPEISTNFILFGRNRFARASSPWKVLLYDRTTHAIKMLDKVENRCGCIFPQDVTDRYATWVKCVARCNVFVYDTHDPDAGAKKIYNPDKYQYAASVSDDGRVYFVRSGRGCGANVQIRATDVVLNPPTSELVFDYPAGTELAASIHVVDGAGGVDDVYFDRADCSDAHFHGNIYRIAGVVPGTTIAARGADPSRGVANGEGALRFVDRPDARPIG